MTTQTNRRPTAKPRKANTAAKPAPRETKRAWLIRLLKSHGGSDIAALSAKLGWQHCIAHADHYIAFSAARRTSGSIPAASRMRYSLSRASLQVEAISARKGT